MKKWYPDPLFLGCEAQAARQVVDPGAHVRINEMM